MTDREEIADLVEEHGADAIRDDILVTTLRDDTSTAETVCPDGGATAASSAAASSHPTETAQIPHPREMGHLGRLWPLSGRTTTVAGALVMCWGTVNVLSYSGIAFLAIGLFILGAGVELARGEGYRAE